MIFYDLKLKVSVNAETQEIEKEKKEDTYDKIGKKINAEFQKQFFALGFSAYVYAVEKKRISVVIAKHAEENMSTVCEFVQKKAEKVLSSKVSIENITEVTVEAFRSFLTEADNQSYIRNERWVTEELKLDFKDNCTFNYEEEIFVAPKFSLTKARKEAKEILASVEYREELERIYSKENVKRFYEHPVHYHVIAENERAAKAMTELLVKALAANGRLLGGRTCRVKDLTEHCYDEKDFEHLICNSQGATVILPMYFGEEKARDIQIHGEEVVSFIGKLVRKYHRKVLFIFWEITSKECIAQSMLKEIEDEFRLICVKERGVAGKQAKEVLYKLIEESEYASLLEEQEELNVSETDSYTMSDIYHIYDDWVHNAMYHKAYKAYGVKELVEVKNDEPKSNAYLELQNMVGLNQIKTLTDEIIAMYKLQNKRRELGMNRQCKSLHMIFTGNPGSAKTTVARLLAGILYKEGIINSKRIVECGRGDLVGKYVGWTAVQVKKKFKEAKGGILFIDEAYSLVDDRGGSFGDEAINTIVQEMENRRDEVIVIFAGYPKKMEDFLNRNEGLRSRIAFHLDFPNYTEDELTEILRDMIRQGGFQCEDDVYEKCREIFKSAVSREDFGNGRYVRNILEQAILRQSRRLVVGKSGSKIMTKELNRLIADDFVMPVGVDESKRNVIGFVQRKEEVG